LTGEAVAKKDGPKGPRLLAKEVKLTVEYDRKRRESRVVADYGGIRWVAGPWAGDYRGREVQLWNKRREYFLGEMQELKDMLPAVSENPNGSASTKGK
jgi:hypothetical protein